MHDGIERISFRFDGLESAEHKLDLYALGESLQGLARIAAVAGHFAVTQKYSRYFSVHEVRILATEPKANCFTVTAVFEFVKQHQILSGSFGAIGVALITFVLSSNARKEQEMKHLKDSLDVAIRELGNRDTKVIESLIGVIDKMASELRPAAKQAAGGRGASRPRPGRAVAPAAKKAVKALRDKGDIIPAEAVKRGRGRPKTVEDRKAYKAQKERERRAKKKPIEASK